MRAAEEALGKVDNGRVILRVRSLEYVGPRPTQRRAMAVYLGVVVALLLASPRSASSASRPSTSARAPGRSARDGRRARRSDILRYFMVENG